MNSRLFNTLLRIVRQRVFKKCKMITIYRVIIIITIVGFWFLLCLGLDSIDLFQTYFLKTGFYLVKRVIFFSFGRCFESTPFLIASIFLSRGVYMMMDSSGGWTSILEEGSSETQSEGTGSVNQPEPRTSPSSNPVASPGGEAGPSNRTLPVVPYPYQENEVIGGDSVESIKRRLLSNDPSPSHEALQFAEYQAQDLFEVKVNIIRIMSVLNPQGDWLRRGARALDNSRTLTGEESLDNLYKLLSDLEMFGDESEAFSKFQNKIPLRTNGEDEHSTT